MTTLFCYSRSNAVHNARKNKFRSLGRKQVGR